MALSSAAAGKPTHSCDWKSGTIILETSKDIVFFVPPLENATLEQETSRATKTFWQQVVVKDFQWLRKGTASPNFQIEIFEKDSGARRTIETELCDEGEDEKSSDEDEL